MAITITQFSLFSLRGKNKLLQEYGALIANEIFENNCVDYYKLHNVIFAAYRKLASKSYYTIQQVVNAKKSALLQTINLN